MRKPLLFGMILTVCIIIVVFVFSLGYPGGMVSYWKFDEESGTTAIDSVNGNPGTIFWAARTTGQVGGALSFDGLDDYVEVPDADNLDITDELTIEAWFYNTGNIDPGMRWQRIIHKNYRKNYEMWIDSNSRLLEFRIGDGSETTFATLSSGTTIQFDTWYHVAAVYDGSSMELYLNGALSNSMATSITALGITIHPVIIGNVGTDIPAFTHNRPFNGLIDEVAIYNRALSEEEIQRHYQDGLHGLGYGVECTLPPSGIVSWWPGDENADDFQDGNNGTLKNGATFATGRVGQAFSFDGVDDYVQINDNSNLHVQELTIDAWVFFDGTASQLQYFLRKYLTNDGGWGSFAGYRFTDNTVGFTVQNLSLGMYPGWRSNVSLAPGWHHVTFTWKPLGNFDISDGTIYIDGSEVPTTLVPHGYSSGFSIEYVNLPLFFGIKLGVPWAEAYQGRLDEVEIFNRALSASEIQAIYNAGSAGKCRVRWVTIDIKPGSYPNSINLGSGGNVPVAILSTPDFDATTVDPTTVALSGASVKLKGKGTPMASFEDVNFDGILDIVVHVDTSALILSEGDTVAVLVGETNDGVTIRGEDTVRIVKEE